MKLSDYVMIRLAQAGVRHVFTVPGGGCMHLVDSLGRSPDLAFVANLHEQGCAVAADAYAQAAKLDPKDATLLIGRADALGSALPQGSGPTEAMIKLYQQALALDPRQADSLWMLGYVAHNNHQDAIAGDYWRRLLAILDPGSQDYADVKKAIDGLGKS